MSNNNTLSLPQNFIENQQHDISLERIPDHVYNNIVNLFSEQYNFQNEDRMRISNYYVKISRSLSDAFVEFIYEMMKGLSENKFPNMPSPDGFKPKAQNLLQEEINEGFSLGSFDMAVTNNGIQNIEFQSVATYPISAAKLNQYLLDNISLKDSFIFADDPATDWDAFIELYKTIIAGDQKDGIVLIDRKIKEQKTNFEFFATQKELNIPIKILDVEDVFEKGNELFYSSTPDQSPVKITRVYNRVLLAEALFEDNYPHYNKMWKFRFDKNYQSLKFINHPIKQFEVSKRLSPYLKHPFNPECHELSEVAQQFKDGRLKYDEYVWKHKWGAAGHRLVLAPNAEILEDLSDFWEDYIAQKKVAFKVFKTDDNQEKIVELRFMTASHNNKTIIVPMARIGHAVKDENGNTQFKIHFGDNNKNGYGFSPVIIYDSKKSNA